MVWFLNSTSEAIRSSILAFFKLEYSLIYVSYITFTDGPEPCRLFVLARNTSRSISRSSSSFITYSCLIYGMNRNLCYLNSEKFDDLQKILWDGFFYLRTGNLVPLETARASLFLQVSRISSAKPYRGFQLWIIL